MTRDPLLRAADIRAATVNVRTNPGTDKGHLGNASEAYLRHAATGAAERDRAALMVRRLANRHGCRPRSQPCPDPSAHAADLAAAGTVLDVLELPEGKRKPVLPAA